LIAPHSHIVYTSEIQPTNRFISVSANEAEIEEINFTVEKKKHNSALMSWVGTNNNAIEH